MTTNKFGIVALAATMMLSANCGGPTDPPDGGTDGGCEPSKADSTCPPDGGDGGQTDFTATVKAFSPAEGLVGKVRIMTACQFQDPPRPCELLAECEQATECQVVISKAVTDPYLYRHISATRLVYVTFEPANSLYVTKTFSLETGKTYEARWGEGEGGIDPGGRTYRGTIGTFTNVRATIDAGTDKVVLTGIGCSPFLTITSFDRACTEELSEKGSISGDLTTIHFEQWRNGVMEASGDALLVQ